MYLVSYDSTLSDKELRVSRCPIHRDLLPDRCEIIEKMITKELDIAVRQGTPTKSKVVSRSL
jgi:hypothetical protein